MLWVKFLSQSLLHEIPNVNHFYHCYISLLLKVFQYRNRDFPFTPTSTFILISRSFILAFLAVTTFVFIVRLSFLYFRLFLGRAHLCWKKYCRRSKSFHCPLNSFFLYFFCAFFPSVFSVLEDERGGKRRYRGTYVDNTNIDIYLVWQIKVSCTWCSGILIFVLQSWWSELGGESFWAWDLVGRFGNG